MTSYTKKTRNWCSVLERKGMQSKFSLRKIQILLISHYWINKIITTPHGSCEKWAISKMSGLINSGLWVPSRSPSISYFALLCSFSLQLFLALLVSPVDSEVARRFSEKSLISSNTVNRNIFVLLHPSFITGVKWAFFAHRLYHSGNSCSNSELTPTIKSTFNSKWSWLCRGCLEVPGLSVFPM